MQLFIFFSPATFQTLGKSKTFVGRISNSVPWISKYSFVTVTITFYSLSICSAYSVPKPTTMAARCDQLDCLCRVSISKKTT